MNMTECNWLKAPELPAEEKITYLGETDVIVIGLGYSGSAALRAAQEAGAQTIGLEAQTEDHYTGFGRDIGHINSKFLSSRGVPQVDPLDLYQEWMRRAGNRANPELVMKYCTKSGEAFDWYTDMYGIDGLKDLHVAFWPQGGEKLKAAIAEGKGDNQINGYHFWYGTAEFPDPMGWPGSPSLPQCAKANLYKAREEGAQLFFGMKGITLVQEKDGSVSGVIAENKAGEYVRFAARRGVILATGDFARNREMVRDLCSDIDDLMAPDAPVRSMGRDGGGVQMGIRAGGMLETRPLPTMGGNIIQAGGICGFGALWLNQDGERFCNEVFGGPEIAGFAANQDNIQEIYAVFDEHCLENELQWSVPGHGGFDLNIEHVSENLQILIESAKAGAPQPVRLKYLYPTGWQEAYYGRTPEELADSAGLTGETAQRFAASIRHYNDLCAAGRDTDYGRDPKVLDPLTDMLFLQKITPSQPGQIMVTVGGLLTNGRQQVIGQGHKIVRGLYATGNCCGRRFGSQYSTPISGVSIGMAVTLGREAGTEAAKGA